MTCCTKAPTKADNTNAPQCIEAHYVALASHSWPFVTKIIIEKALGESERTAEESEYDANYKECVIVP